MNNCQGGFFHFQYPFNCPFLYRNGYGQESVRTYKKISFSQGVLWTLAPTHRPATALYVESEASLLKKDLVPSFAACALSRACTQEDRTPQLVFVFLSGIATASREGSEESVDRNKLSSFARANAPANARTQEDKPPQLVFVFLSGIFNGLAGRERRIC